MTCSLQTYRSRIGNFYPKYMSKPRTPRPKALPNQATYLFIFILISYCGLIANVNSFLQSTQKTGNFSTCSNLQTSHPTKPIYSEHFYHHVWDPGITSQPYQQLVGVVAQSISTKDLLGAIGTSGAGTFAWLDNSHRNKLTHINFGNRGHRGKGINCLYWNKGPAHLRNKQPEIETIIGTHKPHILGLGEANFRHDHDLADVQQAGYSLHLDSCVSNPDLGMARVAVYTHNSLRVKRREDLEDDTVAAVWLECGLPHQKGILVCVGYRQWRLIGQRDNTSASTAEQLSRWLRFLEMWEKAIEEDKEVIVTLDANLDFLTWRDEELPAHHSSAKLKPLIDALFERIFPLGVSQLVRGATRLERGQPRTGLDHLYSNKPDKLSSVQTYFTGMSDHKLLKVTRFAKSLKVNPRFVRKRMFKNFDDAKFREKLSESDLDEVTKCTDVNDAAEMLLHKITSVLDEMAPVKTIQTRSNYAPWLTEDTKSLQAERDAAQEKAAQSDTPEDWRLFRSLRNQATARSRSDKTNWEKKKLDDKENTSTQLWRTVKGWLGWWWPSNSTLL